MSGVQIEGEQYSYSLIIHFDYEVYFPWCLLATLLCKHKPLVNGFAFNVVQWQAQLSKWVIMKWTAFKAVHYEFYITGALVWRNFTTLHKWTRKTHKFEHERDRAEQSREGLLTITRLQPRRCCGWDPFGPSLSSPNRAPHACFGLQARYGSRTWHFVASQSAVLLAGSSSLPKLDDHICKNKTTVKLFWGNCTLKWELSCMKEGRSTTYYKHPFMRKGVTSFPGLWQGLLIEHTIRKRSSSLMMCVYVEKQNLQLNPLLGRPLIDENLFFQQERQTWLLSFHFFSTTTELQEARETQNLLHAAGPVIWMRGKRGDLTQWNLGEGPQIAAPVCGPSLKAVDKSAQRSWGNRHVVVVETVESTIWYSEIGQNKNKK